MTLSLGHLTSQLAALTKMANTRYAPDQAYALIITRPDLEDDSEAQEQLARLHPDISVVLYLPEQEENE